MSIHQLQLCNVTDTTEYFSRNIAIDSDRLRNNLAVIKEVNEEYIENDDFSTNNTNSSTQSNTLNVTESSTNSNHEITSETLDQCLSLNDSKQIFSFEEAFKKYYVDSSQNSNGNFDKYIYSALTLISFLPQQTFPFPEQTIQLPPSKHQKTLVLDLDETLIHSDLDFQFRYHDEILKFTTDTNEEVILPITFRPGLIDFLNFASEHFELVIFTASCKNYADAIIDYIEKDKQYFTKRLYRDSCTFIEPGLYVKDLSILGNRDMKNVVIVDNSIFAFAYQMENGILVTSYYDDKEDMMLMNLKEYLIGMILPSDDIREVNRESFRFEEYMKEIVKDNQKQEKESS